MAVSGGLFDESGSSLKRLATVVRDSNDAIILFDLNGVILQWNHGAEQMYDYHEKDMLGINILNIVPEDKRERYKGMMNRLRRGELVKSFETQRQTKDGRILEVWLTITMLKDEPGRPYAIATTERDITDRIKLEKSLERLATVVRDSNDAIILFDLNGVILQWNHGAEQIYGYSEKDALGINILNIVPEGNKEIDKGMMNRLRRGELVKSFETQRQTKGGQILEVWLTITVLYDETGKSYAIATTERDITERNTIERELIQAREGLELKVQERTKELEKANLGLKALAEERRRAEVESVTAKEQSELYIDVMGHDINNLNQSAMFNLELIADDSNLTEEQRKSIENALVSTRGSASLIDNVRKLQMISGENFELESVDVNDMVLPCIEGAPNPTGKKVVINYTPRKGLVVKGTSLLKEVFCNLIGNSIKYSGGEVTIDITVNEISMDGNRFYSVAVADNGYGIPDEVKPKIFHRFQRGTTKAHGKGLGLYIVNSLLERIGGSVAVEDRVKDDYAKGSKFIVNLPIPRD